MELFFWKVADVSEKQSVNIEAPQYFSRRLRDERGICGSCFNQVKLNLSCQ